MYVYVYMCIYMYACMHTHIYIYKLSCLEVSRKVFQIQTTISTFEKLKPYYIKTNGVHNTCCFHYHVEFQLYYERLHIFYKIHFLGNPPPFVHEIFPLILCNRGIKDVITKKCWREINVLIFVIFTTRRNILYLQAIHN